MKIRFTFLMAFCLMAFFASAQVVDVLTGLNRPWSLALRNNELFIAEDGTGKIIKADISQPNPTAVDVLTGLGSLPFGGMTIKGNELFFAIFNAGVIRKFDVTQPIPSIVDVVTGIPTSFINDILIDGDIIYAANASSSGAAVNSIIKIDLSQSPVSIETIPVGRRQLGLAKSGNNLYFSEGPVGLPTGNIYKLNLSQPIPTPELVVNVPKAFGLTLNGGFLYVTRDGGVSRVDLSQPSPTYEDIVTGLGTIRLCAFDGLDLYISIYEAQGKVVKLGINQPVFPSQPTVCGNTVPTNLGGASPTGGVYSSPGVTNNGDGNTFSFNPTAAGGPGTYTVTYTATNGAQVTSTVTVTAAPVIGVFGFNTDIITPPSPLPDPNAGPSGGVYSGPGMLAGNIFDAGLAGVGVHVLTYTFTDANGCTGTGTGNINVNPAPNDGCSGASNINSLFGAAQNVPQTSGLQDNTNYNSIGDPATGFECHVGDPGLKHTVWYSFIGDGNTYRIRAVQCSATNYNDDTQVVIYSGSDCGALAPVACNDDEDGANGIYNFSIDFATVPGQAYRMLVDGYGEAQGEFCLEVTNLTQPTTPITFALGNTCSNVTATLGGATPTGGVYSGPGVTNNGNGSTFSFNPTTAGGPGNYTVTYTLPNGSSATATVTVTAAPVIGVFGFLTSVNTPPSLLPDPVSGPAGGVYSGVGVLPGNIFDAALAGVGVHLLTYTFTDANGCTGTGTGTISVNPAPHDGCADANDINNLFGEAFNVPQTSALQNNTGYNSNGDPAVSSGCFYQNDAVQSSIWYSFTGDGNTYRLRSVQCSATNYIPDGDTQVAIFTGSCGSPTQVACNDDENGNAGILNFSLDLATVPGENYRVLVDGYGGLQGEFCLEVTNLTQPTTPITFALGTVCSNVTATLGGATPTGGVYSGLGVTNNGNGSTFSFNPTAAGGPGNYTVTYTLPNGSSATATVTVTAAPVIGVFGFITDVATPPSLLPDPVAGPAGGVYSGVGVLSGNIFDAALAGVGVHVITYTFTDANGCTGMGTGTITVNQAATLPADDCATANDINSLFGGAHNVPQTSGLQDNTGYTSTGDPAVSNGCFFQDDAVQSSIWYSFTGDGNTYRLRSVQCSATNYIPNGDTQVAIFTGSCASPTQVACNDDENGNANILNFSMDITTQPGQTYRVLVDGYGGAQGEFCLEVTNLTPSSVTEIGQTNIRVFPNPTTGILWLENVVDADQIQVFDGTGRFVMQAERPGNSIDISEAPAGIYFLKITKGEKVFSARVVKE